MSNALNLPIFARAHCGNRIAIYAKPVSVCVTEQISSRAVFSTRSAIFGFQNSVAVSLYFWQFTPFEAHAYCQPTLLCVKEAAYGKAFFDPPKRLHERN